ncbi:hypothetical protein [Blautia sp. Marseille-P3201T]|uniref:hypothetical protein n=1 Tax=Blautia sp. Marseille-P3201T TaxID=1907659 RepID=UPI000931F438|nr:hypothetical protein [Blautia sp. Marseille-P3201T]
MGKRCSLCGGKLRKGICTECGMDNRKSDERYLYHADKNVSPENVQPVENITAEKKTKRNSVQKQFVFKKQTQNSETKNIKVIFYGAAALVIFVALIAPEFNSETDWELHTEVQEEMLDIPEILDTPDMLIENTEPETDEMFPAVEEWENNLESGLYVVGVDIPAGEYTITAPPGSVFQTYYSPRNKDEYVSFGKAPSGIEEVKNVSLCEEMLVRINGSDVRFFSWNAQVENLAERTENPITKPVQITGKAVAGTDFAEGTYDIEAVGEKEGTFTYSYEDKFHLYVWLKPTHMEGNIYTSAYYKNVVLPEGTQIDTGEMTVTLTPSKGIVSEDYNSFYGNTI